MEEVFIINAHTATEVEKQLTQALDEIKKGPTDDSQDPDVSMSGNKETKQVPWVAKGNTSQTAAEYAIVVNGHSLVSSVAILVKF